MRAPPGPIPAGAGERGTQARGKPRRYPYLGLASGQFDLDVNTRGVVRHVTVREQGGYYVGIELLVRLPPLSVSLLRMGIRDAANDRPETT